MSFTVKIEDWHIQARYWRPAFYLKQDTYVTVTAPEDQLTMYESWLAPIDAGKGLTCDFRGILYKKDKSILAIKDLDNIRVKDDAEYEYNWANNTFKEIKAPPPPVGKFTLTTSTEPAVGYVTKKPDKDLYESGERVKLTAFLKSQYADKYIFQSWWVDDEFLDTANPINFIVMASHHLTAYFLEIEAPPPVPPPPPPPIGVIEKPAEVREWLDNFNWTIVGIEIPLGDTVEYAIDLVIGFINNVLGIAQEAWNKAESIRVTLTARINRIDTAIESWLAMLVNLANELPAIVKNWWEATKPTVLGWIDTIRQGLDKLEASWDYFRKVTFPKWTSQLEVIRELWDDFKKYTLPTLINVTWITDWWSGKANDIKDWIKSAFVERENLWTGWIDWRDQVIEFFTDPEEWLYKAVDRIIDRFW